MKVAWSRRAKAQLELASEYIAERNAAAAEHFLDSVFRAVRGLEDFPAMGRPGRRSGTRELVIRGSPFVVAYRVKDDQVEIVTVVHGAQRWPR